MHELAGMTAASGTTIRARHTEKRIFPGVYLTSGRRYIERRHCFSTANASYYPVPPPSIHVHRSDVLTAAVKGTLVLSLSSTYPPRYQTS